MAKKWIQKAIKHPGALHRQLGVPQGKKIPAGKMAAARAGKYGAKAQKRANFAKTLKSFEFGGTVPGTGPVPIMAHGGETIIPAPSTREQQAVRHFGKQARIDGREGRAARSAYFARRVRGRTAP